MSRPTLLIATPYFPPHAGGLERYAWQIAHRLQRDHGWRVVVVTSGAHKGDDVVQEQDGLKIYRLGYKHKLSNTPFDVGWRRKLKQIIAAEDPLLVNAHAPVAGMADLAVRSAGKRKVVVTYHAGSMRKGQPLLDAMVWLYEATFLRRMLRRADHIICSSDFVRLNFLKAWSHKATTITAAIDPGIFAPAPHLPKQPHLVFIGGLKVAEAHKGLEGTIKAVLALRHTIPNINLTVIGDGDNQAHFETIVRNARATAHVHFTGRLNSERIAAKLSQARLFVLPTRNDSLPTTIIEAMAAGLPIITTPVGSIPSLVRDKVNGLLIQPDDQAQLQWAIHTLLKDQPLALEMREQNLAVVKRYTWQQRAQDTDRIFTRLTNASAKRILMLASGSIHASLTYRVLVLAKQLVQRGHDVTLVVPSADKYNDFQKQKVTELDGVTIQQPYQFATRQPMLNLLPYMANLTWYLLRSKFDLIYLYKPTPITVIGLLAQKLKRTPLVLDMDDLGAEVMRQEGFPAYIYQLVAWCERRVERAANAFVVTSTFLQKKYRHLRPDAPLLIVPNGVDTVQFNMLPPPKKLEPRIVFYGACNSRQDLDPLFEVAPAVFAAYPTCHIIIIGDGSELAHYKTLAHQNHWQKQIEFKGWLPHEEAVNIFRFGDIGYAYKPETDTVKAASLMKVPQYMALGVVPVVSDVGDLAQYVDHGRAGYVCPPNNSQALARCIIEALGDEKTRLQKAAAASRRATTVYNWQQLAEQIDTFIGKLYVQKH